MKKGPFSITTDGSTDEGLVKLNPLLVRFFDNDLGYVHKSTARHVLFKIWNCRDIV